MAIGAHRRLLRASGHGPPMHALQVRRERLGALAAGFHHVFLTVTLAARGGDVGVIHARFRIARRQQFVGAAVTRNAGRGLLVACLDGLRVITAVIGALLVGMAGRAADFRGSGVVRRGFYVRVTIHAGEHSAVNRVLECLGVDVKADGLSVDILRHGGIAMAGQAILVGGLWGGLARRTSGRNHEYQTKNSVLQELDSWHLAPEVTRKCRHRPTSSEAATDFGSIVGGYGPRGSESSHSQA